MFCLENVNLYTKINNCTDSNLQKIIEVFTKQTILQIPNWSYVLVFKQAKLQNIIETICPSHTCLQHKITNYTLLSNLEPNLYNSESELYCDFGFLGSIYPIEATNIYYRYLIFF